MRARLVTGAGDTTRWVITMTASVPEPVAAHSVPTRNYGLHLTLDGYGGDPEKLGDLTRLFDILEALPGEIGMNKIGSPHLIRITEPDVAGISGFIFLLESHISVHTYPYKRFLSMDTYSCREFDTEIVVARFRDCFDLEAVEPQVLVRGRRFPVDNLVDPSE